MSYIHSETVEDDGIIVEIINDEYPEDPRHTRDSLGVVATHIEAATTLGDETFGHRHYRRVDSDIRDHLEGLDVRALVVCDYVDYGGGSRLHVTRELAGAREIRAYLRDLDEDEHDEGNVIAYVTAERMTAEYGSPAKSKCKLALGWLKAELDETDYWVSGSVWGYSITVPGHDELSQSCWGFYCEPDGYVVEAASDALIDVRADLAREQAEAFDAACRDIVTIGQGS